MPADLQRHIPLDVIVLLVLVPAHTQLDGVDFILGLALAIYIALALWQPVTDLADLPEHLGRARFSFLIRLALIYLMIVAACIVPAATRIVQRAATPVDNNGFSPAYGRMHDGALQMESALAFLTDGRNPYVERYDDTPIRFFGFQGIELEENPYFEYFPYLPGMMLASVPAYSLFDLIGLPYDQRLIYLAAYILVVLLLPLLVKAPSLKLLLTAAVGLNPLLVGPTVLGMNEALVVLALVLCALFWLRRRILLSVLFLALAVVFKQSAWFVLPFYIMLLVAGVAGRDPDPRRTIRRLLPSAALFAIVCGLLILPIALWNLPAFWNDVFAYPSGNAAINYPIRGYTVGNLLVGAGLIESALDPFPFWILQLLIGVPALLLLLQYQRQRNNIGMALFCSAFFMFVLGFVSRYFQDNYLGFVTVFMTLGLVLNAEASDQPALPDEPELLASH